MADAPSPAPTAPRTPEDDLVTTQHAVGVGRGRLRYSVTTGRTVLREEVVEDGTVRDPQPRAEIFSTAYVLDDVDPRTRPVTFAFNGGPGSSSAWLHLGLLGPRRVVMGDADALVPPPWGLTDNLETLLRVSDLVFVDPVTTGYSRPATGHQAGDYHGYTRDLESVGEFIRLWTTPHDRWSSAKLLAGESYGTTRAAALAQHLADGCGLYLNGLLLISSVLDIGTVDFVEGNDLPYALYLPTYTAAAHHHGRIGGELRARVAEAEEFAARDLPWALGRGSRLQGAERDAVVARYAELTGLDPGYVDRADLRVDLFSFVTELLRDRGLQLGRLDLRFTVLARPRQRQPQRGGPQLPRAGRALRGRGQRLPARRAGLPHRPGLQPADRPGAPVVVQGVRGPLRRVGLGPRVGAALEPAPAGARLLRLLRRRHPALRRRARLRPPAGAAPVADRITWDYYEAGHMMYVHEPSRLQQSADLAAFVQRVSG